MSRIQPLTPQAQKAVEEALRAHDWSAQVPDGTVLRFTETLAEQLAEELGRLAPVAAASAAYGTARNAHRSHSLTVHEASGRLGLLLSARDAMRAGDLLPAEERGGVRRLAVQLAIGAENVAPRGGSGVGPKASPLEKLHATARKHLAERGEALAEQGFSSKFVQATFTNLADALSLYSARGVRPAVVVQDAVRAAHNTALRAGDVRWRDASADDRRALAERCVLEAAAVMSAVGADGLGVSFEGDDAALWLSRVASQVGAATIHSERWFAEAGEKNSAPPQNGKNEKETNAETTASEAEMKDPQNNTTHPLVKTLQVDATEAAWRTAGSQFVKLAREPLVGLLTRHLAPNDEAFRGRLAAFLETELGTALLASMLSATLSALPQTTGEVPQKLARELRVRAMADAGDVLADVLMGPLRQVMALYLQDPMGIPAAPPALPEAQSQAAPFAPATNRENVRG